VIKNEEVVLDSEFDRTYDDEKRRCYVKNLLILCYVMLCYVIWKQRWRLTTTTPMFQVPCSKTKLTLVKEALIEIGCVMTSLVVGWSLVGWLSVLSRACTVVKRCILGL